MTQLIQQLNWKGLYDHGYGNLITPNSFQHPAKVAPLLAAKIFDFMFEQGWLRQGDRVLDPFFGIGGFGLPALLHGCHMVGIELEPKFVALAQQNIDLWEKRYRGKLPHLGSVRVIQGDSRRLLEVITQAGVVVGSPPYANTLLKHHPSRKLERIRELVAEGKITGREFVRVTRTGFNPNTQIANQDDYGTSSGQLGALPAGDVNSAIHQRGQLETIQPKSGKLIVNAAVSSPPYEANNQHGGHIDIATRKHIATYGYGETVGNIGNEIGDTFWSASRVILQQCYSTLKPGGHCAWTCKRFVRHKQIVEFSQQWTQLCESAGFETVAWAKAWQTTDHGTQLAIDGNHKSLRKSRKGFFRRLHESKFPETAIDWEDVIFVVKN